LRSDLLELIERACDGRLAGATIDWDARAAVCVVLAAEGYPGAVERGRRIEGVEALRAWEGGEVFHAGTKRPDGALVTDGGRVLGVLIAGAGGAAHLAGVVAAHTTLPVIGVPVAAGGLGGLDALLATVQMPPGVPVATVAIGRGGAENAAILAAQILSLKNRALRQRLERFKAELAESVEGKNLRLQRKLFPESPD